MRLIILYIVLLLFLQSCKSHKKDLAKITFIEKYDTFFGDIPHEFNLTVYAKTYTGYYESESEEILNFNEVNLSDTNEEGGFGTNSVRFAFTTKDHILCEYIVDLNTKKSIQKMIDALNSKFGKAKFVSKLDLTDDLPDSYIW